MSKYEWPEEIPSEEYIRLYFLEKTLRQFIGDRLSKITSKWWKQRVPWEIRKKAEDRKKEEEKRLFPIVNLHPIWYVDFAHYIEIVTRDDNWREVFKQIFRNKDDFKVTLMKLVPIRNKIAHMRPLNTREKKSLDALSEDLLVHIWNFFNERYVKPAGKARDNGRFEEAEEILLHGYEETRGDPWIAYNLGELYERMGQLEKAKNWVERAVIGLPLPRYKEKAKEKLQKIEEQIRLLNVKVCPRCGSMEPKENLFCSKCGYEFSNSSKIVEYDVERSDLCKWLHEQLERLPLLRFPFDLDQLPSNGIYFFYEEGEVWGHGGDKPRIVRVGTHKRGNFRKRIAEHYLLDESRMNFDENRPKPSDRSIFRKNIGRAILNKREDDYLEIWEKDFIIRENREKFGCLRNIKKEKEIEFEITKIIRENFSFRFIKVDDQVRRIGSAGLESSLIGTIANCKLCKPSKNWLGNYSPKKEIRESGLWLVQHLKARSINKNEKRIIQDAIERTLDFLSTACT